VLGFLTFRLYRALDYKIITNKKNEVFFYQFFLCVFFTPHFFLKTPLFLGWLKKKKIPFFLNIFIKKQKIKKPRAEGERVASRRRANNKRA
jgi:hypothetical protein